MKIYVYEDKVFLHQNKDLWNKQTLHKKKFPNKHISSKYKQIRRKLQMCSYILKKYLTENFSFCALKFVKSQSLPSSQYLALKPLCAWELSEKNSTTNQFELDINFFGFSVPQ